MARPVCTRARPPLATLSAMSQTVAVIGLGRVGLPLALFLAERGCTVHGVDASADLLATLRAGRMPFLEEGGPELSRIVPTASPQDSFAEMRPSRVHGSRRSA